MFDPRSARHVRDYREYKDWSSPENVVIFHFSIGSPVSKLFFRVPDRKIMIYHNITPHEYFVDAHRVLARECYKGRLEINLFVDKVDLAVGDSDFNRRELEAVGYKRTGVLPILMNFAKFDGRPDPVTERIFDNGKTTILFVGRIIPNKKFEDVIKIFYFYKKYFNPDSQLILAGDHRGPGAVFRLSPGSRRAKPDPRRPLQRPRRVRRAPGLLPRRRFLSQHERARRVRRPDPGGVLLPDPGPRLRGRGGRGDDERGRLVLREKDFLRTAALIDSIQRDGALRQIIQGSSRP